MLDAAQSAKLTLTAIEEMRSPALESELKLQDLRARWPDLTARAVSAIDSTNEALKRLLRDPHTAASGPLLLIADSQSDGRGRSGRSWHGQSGRSLLFSLSLPWERPGAPIPFAAGLAVRDGIADVIPEAENLLAFKWPNDVNYNGRKLSGILCESIHRGAVSYLVCGIGLNVLPVDLTAEGIESSSVSELARSTERSAEYQRTALLHAITVRLQKELQDLRTPGGYASVMERYTVCCSTVGRDITWNTADGRQERGYAEALTADGGLAVLRLQGGREILTASEIMEVRPNGKENGA